MEQDQKIFDGTWRKPLTFQLFGESVYRSRRDIFQRCISKFRKDMCIEQCLIACIGAKFHCITHGKHPFFTEISKYVAFSAKFPGIVLTQDVQFFLFYSFICTTIQISVLDPSILVTAFFIARLPSSVFPFSDIFPFSRHNRSLLFALL